MKELTVNLLTRYPTLSEDLTISNFCLLLESLYHDLFEKYHKELNLKKPPYGFIAEDCFTPWGDEECFPIIEESFKAILAIGQQLAQIKHRDAFQQTELRKFTSYKDTLNYLEKRFQYILPKYEQLFSKQKTVLAYYRNLTKKYGERQRNSIHIVENLYSCITDMLWQFSKTRPHRKFNYLFQLALVHHHLKLAGYVIHYRASAIKTPIEIPYRDEGMGQGPFYDHYTFQRATGYPTAIGRSNISTLMLSRTIRKNTYSLPYGETDYSNKKIPPTTWYETDEKGLLVITGRARDTETKRPDVYLERKKSEQALIKKALLTGRPILSICAGSWRLLEVCGGQTVEVSGHNNRSGMPRKITDGTIGYNLQIHRIEITKTSLLAEAMGYVKSLEKQAQNPNERFRPTVNSVHWAAASRTNFPSFLAIAATSLRDDEIAPSMHQTGASNEVEANTIEAFESKFGAPLFGIQWHPEAYEANAGGSRHHQLLKFCAKAGEAYSAKRRMLSQFNRKLTTGELARKFTHLRTVTRINAAANNPVDQLESTLGQLKIK